MEFTNRKPLPTIGVDRYTFFKVKSDTAAGLTYEAPYSLKGTVQITPTDSGGSDTFAADNGLYDLEVYTEKIGHDIENADIPPEVDAYWRGLELKNGAFIHDGSSKTVYFAVAWKLTKSDGSHRYVKFFKGGYSLASNVGGKTKPASGASDKQTAKATYTAVKPDYNGNMYMYIDEADVKIGETGEGSFRTIAEFEEAWFSDMGTLLGDEKVTTVSE